MRPSHPNPETVSIDGVSGGECSVIATTRESSGTPVILVHGILDNLRRWITPAELRRYSLEITEPARMIPMYQGNVAGETNKWQIPEIWEGEGLFGRLLEEGRAAVAYSYQDAMQPVADLPTAVEKLHRVADWSLRRWDADRVIVVAHSRGGLITRHALLRDTSAMSRSRFQRSLDRLITIGTPHLGSQIAKLATPLHRTMQQIGNVVRQSQSLLPYQQWINLELLGRVELFLMGIGQLAPESPEVLEVASSKLPPLPGGYFAIAGNVPTLLRIDLPILRFRIPPPWDIPEWTDGEGDMAVRVTSALDIPHPTANNTRILPVNHMTATRDRGVHDVVREWVRVGSA